MHELADGALDHLGLVGDLLDLDALGHGLHEIIGGLLDLLAEFEDVGALGGDHADAERGLALTALAPSSAPVTRSGTRCEEVSTVPADVTLFCLASESNSACGVMPSVASLACENSTKIRSSWVP